MLSKDVTMPSTTGKPPLVSTGEWRPAACTEVLAVTVVAMTVPSFTTHIVWPTWEGRRQEGRHVGTRERRWETAKVGRDRRQGRGFGGEREARQGFRRRWQAGQGLAAPSLTWTFLACSRVAQHVAPTGTWWPAVRVTVLFAADARATYAAAFASGLAIDRSETTSVVSAPSCVAASISSPSLRASMREGEPSALVTIDDEGKHGSPAGAPGDGGFKGGGGLGLIWRRR